MATGNINVYVVDVGQGQCTYVEVLNTADKIIHTLLFDCGSDKYSESTAKVNLDWIATRVLTMDTPGFDGIFFSHSDKDHTSLTAYLVDKIAETKKPVVSLVWYAGAKSNYTKSGFNILNYLVSKGYCAATNEKTTQSDYTGYDYKTTKKFTQYLWQSTDAKVKVYAIVSNVLSNDPDWEDHEDVSPGNTAEVRNRVSMVCGLYYGTSSCVICGDATNTTMAAIGNLFKAGTTVFDNNKMTTLPHHGSRATGFAVPSSKEASVEAIAVVDTFASILKSKMISISAFEKHRHPSLQLMDRFIPTVTTPVLKDSRIKGNYHLLVGYLDIDLTKPSSMFLIKNIAQCFTTKTNTFSTRYKTMTYATGAFSYELGTTVATAAADLITSGTAINGFASWLFTLKSDGLATTDGYANLGGTLFTAAPDSAVLVAEEKEIKPIEVRKTQRKYRTPVFQKSRLTNRLKTVA